MSKFHINKHGVPAPCRAKKGNCPLGGADTHFDNEVDAQAYADKLHENEFNYLPKTHNKESIKEFLSRKEDEVNERLHGDGESFGHFGNKHISFTDEDWREDYDGYLSVTSIESTFNDYKEVFKKYDGNVPQKVKDEFTKKLLDNTIREVENSEGPLYINKGLSISNESYLEDLYNDYDSGQLEPMEDVGAGGYSENYARGEVYFDSYERMPSADYAVYEKNESARSDFSSYGRSL